MQPSTKPHTKQANCKAAARSIYPSRPAFRQIKHPIVKPAANISTANATHIGHGIGSVLLPDGRGRIEGGAGYLHEII
jgi:hypothetical protein